jgi:hypothetical protein
MYGLTYGYLGVASISRHPLPTMLALVKIHTHTHKANLPCNIKRFPMEISRHYTQCSSPSLLSPPRTRVWSPQRRKHLATTWDTLMDIRAQCRRTMLIAILQHVYRSGRKEKPLSTNWRTTTPTSWVSACLHSETNTLTEHEETGFVRYISARLNAAYTYFGSHQLHLATATFPNQSPTLSRLIAPTKPAQRSQI